MRTASWIGIALVASIAASCAPYTYDTESPRSTGAYYGSTDFNGAWELVTNRSDDGRDWLDERSRFGADDWGSADGGDGTYQRARYGAWFLPDEFRISGGRDLLRIEDSNGGLIAEIALDTGYRYGSYPNDDIPRGSGAHWIDDRRFVRERLGRNRRITQSFTLQNRRRQLMVITQIERDGDTRSYTRIYERV